MGAVCPLRAFCAKRQMFWQKGERKPWRAFQLVRNKTELQNINNNLSGSYLLAGNIDESGESFAPIGNNEDGNNFTGQFNGMNYEIRNLKIEKPDSNYIGLFGDVGATGTVKNVGVTGGTIKGADYVGGIVGYNAATIKDVYNTGNVKGSENVGGIVGMKSQGSIFAANRHDAYSADVQKTRK